MIIVIIVSEHSQNHENKGIYNGRTFAFSCSSTSGAFSCTLSFSFSGSAFSSCGSSSTSGGRHWASGRTCGCTGLSGTYAFSVVSVSALGGLHGYASCVGGACVRFGTSHCSSAVVCLQCHGGEATGEFSLACFLAGYSVTCDRNSGFASATPCGQGLACWVGSAGPAFFYGVSHISCSSLGGISALNLILRN